MKRTAEFAVAVAAAVGLVWRRNRQRSLPQEGSGYVPADFQAEKTKIIAPGQVSVEGRKNGLHRGVIRRLLIAAKASRRFASLLIRRIRLRRIFFGFREVESKPADLSLSHGSLKTNLEGVTWTGTENGSAAAFRQLMDRYEQYVRISIKQALKRPEIAELLKYFVLKLFRRAHLILNTPRTYEIIIHAIQHTYKIAQ